MPKRPPVPAGRCPSAREHEFFVFDYECGLRYAGCWWCGIRRWVLHGMVISRTAAHQILGDYCRTFLFGVHEEEPSRGAA